MSDGNSNQGRAQLPVNPPSIELVILAAIFFDGIKGGVGKSWVARLFAYFLQLEMVQWAGVDGDPNNPHLFRFHPSNTTQTDATNDTGFDVVLDAMGGQRATSLLVDLPAGAGARLGSQMPALRAAASAENMRLIRVFVMEPTYDSPNQFKATGLVVDAQDTLVVLNNRFGRSDAFDFWRGTETRAEFLKSGGTEANIGKLDDKVVSYFEVNPMNLKLSFLDALSNSDVPGRVRFRLTVYLWEVATELRRVFKALELIR
ncbi:P-loop NTPase family protein [Glacieibacterium frigidum]|uniref:Uncharacterized protein n=1 Tax=Glacieibacterium frigidum TaxID=2593303 RepID=A0A552UHN8_9SPHN|nr:hypothetical protein [Glacieibacterium frigidum]TRW17738.1 hypothetical protein FMM06_06270 [Glacieibacterium frigidum]